MSIDGSWNITITRRDGCDGSQLYRTRVMPHAPVIGKTIEVKDDKGLPMIARIGTFHYDPPKLAGLPLRFSDRAFPACAVAPPASPGARWCVFRAQGGQRRRPDRSRSALSRRFEVREL
jgi:hypothetical protein